jgi:pimeloyl-ACP methyl ester carboxylesterase
MQGAFQMRAMIWTAAAIGAAFSLALAAPAAAQTPVWETVKEPVALVAPKMTGRRQVGDVELYYEIYGEGRPVILLHDALGNASHWANQVGPLSLDRQVIVVDARGHGRSTRGDKPFSYGQMAEDVFGLMRQLGVEDVTVVGWGDGAIVGLDLAMRHPGWVRRLVMFGGNYDLSGLKPGVEKTATFAAYARKALADYNAMSPAADFERLFADMRTMWKKEPAYTARDLRKVKAPTVVMIAEHDETVEQEHSQKLAQALPAGRLLMLPGVSHFAPWQDPRRFNDTLRLALDY